MKALYLIITMIFALEGYLPAQKVVIREDIQSWTERVSFGNYNQPVQLNETQATIKLTGCSVSPTCSAEGTGSAGCVVVRAYCGIVELPELPSVSSVSFRIGSISSGKSVKLQRKAGQKWVDVATLSAISSPARDFTIEVNSNEPTTLRLSSANSNLYLFDIVVTDTPSQQDGVLAARLASTH